MVIPYRTAIFNINFLQWRFWAQPPNLTTVSESATAVYVLAVSAVGVDGMQASS